MPSMGPSSPVAVPQLPSTLASITFWIAAGTLDRRSSPVAFSIASTLVTYLNEEQLKPGEFGILAGVSQRQEDLNASFGDRTLPDLPEIAPVPNWIRAASCQRSSFDRKRARRLAGQNRQLCVRIADLWAQALPELLENAIIGILSHILAPILLRDRPRYLSADALNVMFTLPGYSQCLYVKHCSPK